jgi:transportin-1
VNYLMFIFARIENAPVSQMAAGHLLKNNITRAWKSLPTPTQTYVKAELTPLLAAVHGDAATIVGSILSAVLRAGGITAWPQLLPRLAEHLDEQRDEPSLVAALQACLVICEDCTAQLDAHDAGRPINALMPRLLAFVRAPYPRICELALRCVNCFVASSPLALISNLPTYLESLFLLAGDAQPRIRTLVCVAFERLAEQHADQLAPHMTGIIQFILHTSRDSADPDLQLAASKFWSALGRYRDCAAFVAPFVAEIVPVLLNNMVYSPAELAALPQQQDDAAVPDDPREVRPHIQGAARGGDGGGGGGGGGGGDGGNGDDDDDDDDDENDGDGAAVENGGDAPTVRRASARALDVLSRHMPDDVMKELSPLLNLCFTSGDWLRIESAILAIGAVSDGCLMPMQEHLPQLIPFLLEQAASEQMLVRTIAAWTLARYSKWIVGQREPARYFEPALERFMTMAQARSKYVQNAGISALATLIEVSAFNIVPYLTPVVTTLMHCFRTYQKSNLLTCYDAIVQLAYHLGDALRSSDIVAIMMPPIAERWAQMPDDDSDSEVFSMYDTLIELTIAFGPLLGNFVGALVQRSTVLARDTVAVVQRYEDHRKAAKANGQLPSMEAPTHALLISALDLLAASIEAVGADIAPALDAALLPDIVVGCMRVPLFDVRGSCAALIGDLAVHAPAVLEPALERVVPLLLHNVREDLLAPFTSLVNNCIWSLGEIALLLRERFEPVVAPMLERVLPVLCDDGTHPDVLHNCAVCISRASILHAAIVAPHVGQFLKQWCYALRNMSASSERLTAFAGLCCVVDANPRDVMPDFVYVADAIASFTDPPPELESTFRQLLGALRDAYGEHWNAYYAAYPADLRFRLDKKYFQ